MALRFVSWAAVSSLPQAKKISLADQARLNREHVERWGGVLVEELIVPGESRSIILFEEACLRIGAYQRLRELIEGRGFDVLIYYDRSRLGRKASLSMALVELCRSAGASVYEVENPPASLDELRRPSSHDEMLIGAIKSVGAQQEVERLRERHRRGMRDRILRGSFPARPLFGYRYAYDQKGERGVEIVEAQAGTVRLIFELYLDWGMGVPAIMEELRSRGHLTATGKQEWSRAAVQKILQAAWTYAGYAEYNRYENRESYLKAPGQWQAIISEEQAETAEMQRRVRARKSTWGNKRRYSAIFICGACGSLMQVGGAMRIKSGEHTQYRCPDRCVGGSIYENRATAELAEEFVALQDEGVAGYVPQQENRERERVAREIAEGEGALAQMEEERLRLARLVVRGSLSEGEYDLLLGEIESKAAGLAVRLEMARQRRIDLEDVERRVIRLQEVVEAGPGVLAGEDERAVNSWLRKHLRAYVVGNHVAAVDWI